MTYNFIGLHTMTRCIQLYNFIFIFKGYPRLFGIHLIDSLFSCTNLAIFYNCLLSFCSETYFLSLR